MARYIDYDKLNEWVEKQNCDAVMCDNRHCIGCYIGENGYEDAVEVVHAKWQRNSDGFMFWLVCSNCGYDEAPLGSKFCPNCGAIMDKGV